MNLAKGLEASAYQSVSESTTKTNQFNALTLQYGPFFQFYDQIYQNINLPGIIDVILVAWLGFQVIFTSLWVPYTSAWYTTKTSTDFITYFNSIVNFLPLSHVEVDKNSKTVDNDLLYTFISYTILFVLSVAHLLFQIICSKTRGRLISSTLYTSKIFLVYIPAIVLHPIGILTGELLVRIVNLQPYSVDSDSNIIEKVPGYFYALFAFSFVYFLYFEILFYFSFHFMACSAYLPSSVIASYDFTPVIRIVSFSSSIQFLANIMPVFPEWSIYFLVVIHALLVVHAFFQNYLGVMIYQASNIMLLATVFICFICDIGRLVLIGFKTPNGTSYMIFFLVIFILSNVGTTVYYILKDKYLIKKINEILDEEDDVLKKEESRCRIYNDLGLDRNTKRAIDFLNFIISHHIYQLLDFVTIKYIITAHHTRETIIHCLRIVAFFPCMTSYLNVLSSELSKTSEINVFHKFLLYEIQRIKIHRQSSSSAAAVESLKFLTSQGKEIESNIRYFWEQSSLKPQVLCGIASRISKLQMLWEEEISHFQNSTQHYTDFERFLIECKTDYTGSVYQHYKRGLVESGSMFRVDRCYALFIKQFPNYLKDQVMSVTGRFIAREGKGDKTGSSSANSNIMSTSTSSEIDAALEHNLGRNLFNQTRLRIALQHATRNKKARSSSKMIIGVVVSTLLSIAFPLFIYLFFKHSLDDRGETTARIELSTKMRFFNALTQCVLFFQLFRLEHFDETHSFDDDDIPFGPFFASGNLTSWVDSMWTVRFNLFARQFYEAFVANLVAFANKGNDLTSYVPEMFEKSTKSPVCTKTDSQWPGMGGGVTGFMKYDLLDLKQVFMYNTFQQSLSASMNQENPRGIFDQDWMCYLMNSTSFLPDSFTSLTVSMQSNVLIESQKMDRTLEILQYTGPVVFFVVCSLLVIIFCITYLYEIKYLLELLLALPPSVKKQSSDQIFRLVDKTDLTGTESPYSSAIIVVPAVFGVLLLFGTGITEYLQLNFLKEKNSIFSYLQYWTTDSRIRKANVMEMFSFLIYRLIIGEPYYSNVNYVYYDNITESFKKAWGQLKERTGSLMSENDDSPVPLGLTQEIDEYLIKQWCVPDNNATLHDLYKCSSSQQVLSLYGATLSNIMKNPEIHRTIMGIVVKFSDSVKEIPHMINYHILPLMIRIDEGFSKYSVINRQDLYANFDIFIIVECVLVIVSFFLFSILIFKFESLYKIALIILRRVPPTHLLSDVKIIAYLLNKKSMKENAEMSSDQRIVHSSKDAIICTDPKGIIDMVNPSVSQTFGYTPEQLLGQPFTSLIAADDKVIIDNQIHLMANKQSAATYEGHINCMSDDESTLNCLITILAISNEKGAIEQFVVIMRDESQLLLQQKNAEIAKKQSESLLYQILPRDIVIRLNQGEKDISFTVQSSSIIFIDIVKFSEYAASLSPQDIMNNLSIVFGAFDLAITKYNLLIKIKLIGDVYMAAGGLFTPDEAPSVHALQMARFAIEVLQIMEDINMKLNSVLNIRIGINTGGPLIAGVLGSDKPTFDIIGDPINIAARLQSTDLPGNVQISQSTYDLISSQNEFQIEPRGEIMLKGKGKTMTYMILPFKACINSESSFATVSTDQG